MRCPHKYEESESAVYTEGLCPLCLAADNNRLRVALEKMADPLMLNVYGTGTQRALKIIEAMRAIAKEALEN